MLHLLCWGIDNQCAQLPPPCVCTCECSLGLCRVVVCRCTKRLFSNCRVQDSLCKVDTNECNENLFSNCRVQDNLCKVTTFFSLIRVTLSLCCFLAQDAYVLSLPSYAVLFCTVWVEVHTSLSSFLQRNRSAIGFAAALHAIRFCLCSRGRKWGLFCVVRFTFLQ